MVSMWLNNKNNSVCLYRMVQHMLLKRGLDYLLHLVVLLKEQYLQLLVLGVDSLIVSINLLNYILKCQLVLES